MKKSLIGLILFLAFVAMPIAARAQAKIGVINLTSAIGSTQEVGY